MFKKNVLFNANLDGLADIPAWYTLVTSYNYESQVADKLNKMKLNFQGQANLWMVSWARGGEYQNGSCLNKIDIT